MSGHVLAELLLGRPHVLGLRWLPPTSPHAPCARVISHLGLWGPLATLRRHLLGWPHTPSRSEVSHLPHLRLRGPLPTLLLLLGRLLLSRPPTTTAATHPRFAAKCVWNACLLDSHLLGCSLLLLLLLLLHGLLHGLLLHRLLLHRLFLHCCLLLYCCLLHHLLLLLLLLHVDLLTFSHNVL